MRWRDSVAVIVGASRGIGREVALAASARGARVGLVARTEADLEATLAEAGGRGVVAVADVADRHQLGAAIAAVESALGPPDILVANAGIGAYGPFAEVTPEEMDRLVAVNVLGTLHAVRAVVPGMVARQHGHIVTVASIAGRLGAPSESLYSATKFAQVGLTEALSVELAPHGVGVSMVNPGPVATGFFDARGHRYERRWPRPMPPERVAAAVMAAVERDRAEQFLPRWLRAAVIFRHLAPPLYRRGAKE